MNKRLLDLNMLSSLEQLCGQKNQYPHQSQSSFLLTPSWVKDKSALAQLLLQESLGYHEVELEVCRRQLCEIEREEKKLRAQIEVEYDPRTGKATQIFPSGYQDAISEQARLHQKMQEHASEISKRRAKSARLHVAHLLCRFQICPHNQTEESAGEVIEIFGGSYGLEPDPEMRLLLRRFYLNLPDDKDWPPSS